MAAEAVVFVGPTLPGALPAGIARRPPAAFGDVYRAAAAGARIIGLVDGYFEQVPSVWHKEVLWALQEGVQVLGSASMGALRAAELAPFGMDGVGWIFEAFRDGVLMDDDEVAVRHGPAELGYPAISEAMVNIRATLDRAVREAVVSQACADTVGQAAKRLFYGERSFARAIEIAAGADSALSADLGRLRAWLPTGRVDRKREDALQMVAEIERRLQLGLECKRVEFELQRSSLWEAARAALDNGSGGTTAAAG